MEIKDSKIDRIIELMDKYDHDIELLDEQGKHGEEMKIAEAKAQTARELWHIINNNQ